MLYSVHEKARLLAELNDLLSRAIKSKMYKAKFKGMDLKLKSLADFENLPFTTAEDISKYTLLERLSVPLGRVAKILSSSGNPKVNKLVGYSKKDAQFNDPVNSIAASRAIGIPDKGYLLNLLPEGWLAGSDMLVGAMKATGQTVISPPLYMLPQFLPQVLQNFRITTILSLPTKLYQTIRLVRACGFDPSSLGVKAVVLTGETVSKYMAQAIARELGGEAALFNYYGACETGGIGYGRLGEFLVYPGSVVEFGADGEIVVTTLDREASPVVRYRTGDYGEPLDGSDGNDIKFRMRGRLADRINADYFAVDIEDLVFPALERVVEYYLTLSDSRLVLNAAFPDSSRKPELERLLKNKLNMDVGVNFIDPAGIPASPGKYRRIVN